MQNANSTRWYQNEDFEEAAEDAKPISTGPVGSHLNWVCMGQSLRTSEKRAVLQATWIHKLRNKNLGNFNCQIRQELVP